MPDRNIACKTCGTKVFKMPEEVDAHHKEAHPEVESQDTGAEQNGHEDQKSENQ